MNKRYLIRSIEGQYVTQPMLTPQAAWDQFDYKTKEFLTQGIDTKLGYRCVEVHIDELRFVERKDLK